jgi:hypothetical protein
MTSQKAVSVFILFICLVSEGFSQIVNIKEEVKEEEPILVTFYQTLSGSAGRPRDWDRFRYLFHPSAIITSATNDKNGKAVFNTMNVEQFIKYFDATHTSKGMYYEQMAHKVQSFGNIRQVFSTFRARRSLNDTKNLERGIQSFQLLYDGRRLWILSVVWDTESKDNPIPAENLKY